MKNKLIEKKALDFRQTNGLNGRESIHLESLLQSLGVVTLFKPMSSDFSGMAIKVSQEADINRFMLVNSNQTLGRQNFTICHELYHLFIQENFSFATCNTGTFLMKDKEEYNADIFAAYLLMPHDGIINLVGWDEIDVKDGISIETILKIEQYFSCSRSALVFRLQEMGMITKDYANELKANPRKDATMYGFDTKLYEKGNENRYLGDYGLVAKELYDSEKISESHYYELMLDLGVKFE
ncbi:ImmA/IrrE family metallo-endopeptidase [Arcicella aquatica]|uniref:ImmA/IrrE family metallo-endopeptidase n=1 Tax=Arcicella aquatica TaxID=217141 RepID=A0ABU5QV18_9BACT|nr:ImmA/IrrE family metallo-endopeptidase [Arcicella aquatica]MEA5260654.1 ImmA/IrrE family metallo-endopeptidase [Arcicella aquatica]